MTAYKTFGPDAEVSGHAMLAFVEAINYQNFASILEKHHLESIDPDRWYPQQIWLDVFSDISSSSDLVSIGMKIADTASMPPEMASMPFIEVMSLFDEGSYKANNRGADIGGIEMQVIEDSHIVMIDKTPYPDDFVYGAYYAMARKFVPQNYQFTVFYDETTKRREEGGEATRVHIKWD